MLCNRQTVIFRKFVKGRQQNFVNINPLEFLIFARQNAPPLKNIFLIIDSSPICNCDSRNFSMLHDLAPAEKVYHVRKYLVSSSFPRYGGIKMNLSFEKRICDTNIGITNHLIHLETNAKRQHGFLDNCLLIQTSYIPLYKEGFLRSQS